MAKVQGNAMCHTRYKYIARVFGNAYQKIVITIIMELSAYATTKQESNATCIYYEIYRKIYSKQL